MFERRNIKYKYLRLSKRIKDFLVSKQTREFLIFLFFFFIAASFWLVQTLKGDYETDFVIPVKLTNVPQNAVITSELPSSIKVRVKDKGTILLNYKLSKYFLPVTLNFSDYKSKGNKVNLPSLSLDKKIMAQFNFSTHLVSVKPDTLEYVYATGEAKQLPISICGKVTPGRQYFISDTVFSPKSVLVYAPKEILDTMTAVYTERIELENITDTAVCQVKIAQVPGVKYVPSSVNLKFPVDIYTEKTVEVPLYGVNFPADKVLRSFPSRVKVTFLVGLSRFNQIKSSDFVACISYEDLIRTNSDRYVVQLKSMPSDITLVRIQPEQVDFLIEQISTDGD